MSALPARRIALQLTPLLDLLLIVIFAQYLEVRTVLKQSEGKHAAQRAEEQARLDAVTQRRDELVEQSGVIELKLARTQSDQEQFARLMAELLRVPEATLQQLLRARSNEPGPSPSDLATVRQELQSLAKDDGRRMVEHFLKYGELRKRCDEWDLYVQEDGLVLFRGSGRKQSLRATTIIEFEARLGDLFVTLPQPKSVVIVNVRWGDVRFELRDALLKGLPLALERMRTETQGQTRFFVAPLGYWEHYEDLVE